MYKMLYLAYYRCSASQDIVLETKYVELCPAKWRFIFQKIIRKILSIEIVFKFILSSEYPNQSEFYIKC